MGCSSSCNWQLTRSDLSSTDREGPVTYNPQPMLSDLIEVQAAILVPGALCGDDLHAALSRGDEKPGHVCRDSQPGPDCKDDPLGDDLDKAACHGVRPPMARVDVTITTLAFQRGEVSATSSLVMVDT